MYIGYIFDNLHLQLNQVLVNGHGPETRLKCSRDPRIGLEIMGAGTFQKVVRLGLNNERSRREDRGAFLGGGFCMERGCPPPQPTRGSGGAS